VSGSVIGVEQIAVRQKCSMRQLNMTISLAFLAPDLVRAETAFLPPRIPDFQAAERSFAP
jgi:hypothetical protein